MATEKRLIDANALTSEFEWLKSVVNESSKDEIQDVIQRIKNAPTVDAVEVVHGRWCFMGTWEECSVCGHAITVDDVRTNYCPNCGAKMDGDGNGC